MQSTYMDLVNRLHKLQLLRRCFLQSALEGAHLHFGQLPVLEYISKHTGCTQVEISDNLAVSPASIALSTKRMQKAGLIEKKIDEQNLRCKRLYLTPKGAQASIASRRAFNEFDARMFQGFSETELADLRLYLDRMTQNITDEPAGRGHCARHRESGAQIEKTAVE